MEVALWRILIPHCSVETTTITSDGKDAEVFSMIVTPISPLVYPHPERHGRERNNNQRKDGHYGTRI